MTEPDAAPKHRMLGLDVARALAIIGMVMVHFGPTRSDEDLLGRLYGMTHGRASILFVVLAGIGVSLLAGDRSLQRLRSAGARLAFRALLLLPMGLALQELDVNVLVILQYYALYFLVAFLLVPLGDRVVLAVAAVAMVGGPVTYIGLWRAQPEWFASRVPAAWSDGAGEIIRDLLLTGSYPVLTWIGPVLFGLWLGRQDLRSTAVRVRLVVGGAVTAGVAYGTSTVLTARYGAPTIAPAWDELLVAEAHSQMPLWLLGATGVATAVVGASLLVSTRLPRGTWPLAATGQLALTVYVGHLLVLGFEPDLLVRETVEGAVRTVGAFTAVTVVLCSAWRAVLSRGPLEAVLRLPWAWRPRPRETPG